MGARLSSRSPRGRAPPGLLRRDRPARPSRGGGAAAPAPHGGGRAGPGGAWPGGEARRGVPLEAARSPCGSPPAQEERRPCPARREDAENGGCRRRGAERRPRRGVRAGARGWAGAAWGLLPPGLGCAPALRERRGARRSPGERSLPPAPPSCAPLPGRSEGPGRGRARTAGSWRGGAASPP